MGEIREEHTAFDVAPPNGMPNAFVGHLADSGWGAPALAGGRKRQDKNCF